MSFNFQDGLQWFSTHAADWLITGIVTYYTAKGATYRYYDATKKEVSKGIMELGLRSLLKLEHDESIPDYAQAIFVEYKGRTFKIADPHCRFCSRIRKTVVVVGGNRTEVSAYRAINYGVLGVANSLESLVLYDFDLHQLYYYRKGKISALHVTCNRNEYYYKTIIGPPIKLGENNSQRDVMIAIPLKSNGRLVGGLTFDLRVGEKTLYQKYYDDDDEYEKHRKDSINIRVFKEAYRCSRILINAYFKTKGDEME